MAQRAPIGAIITRGGMGELNTVLITGGVGCIGSDAVRLLVEAGLASMLAVLAAQPTARSS